MRLCLMFWIGVVVARHFDSVARLKCGTLLELALLALSLGAIELSIVWRPGGVIQAIVMTVRDVSCLVIVLTCIFDGWFRRALSTGPMVFLGKISYSLYLTNAIVIGGLDALLPRVGVVSPLAIAGLSLITCMMAAVIFWRVVEVPSMKFSRALGSSHAGA